MNLAYFQEATGLGDVDFFLARTTDHSHDGSLRAVNAPRTGPGARWPISIDSTETTFGKDQSSLTVLNVNGLVDIDSLYTLLMTAAAMAIFVFGLTLRGALAAVGRPLIVTDAPTDLWCLCRT